MNDILNDYAEKGSWQEKAQVRIKAESEPRACRALSMAYDWDNQGRHWEWVATADIDEIIDWALLRTV